MSGPYESIWAVSMPHISENFYLGFGRCVYTSNIISTYMKMIENVSLNYLRIHAMIPQLLTRIHALKEAQTKALILGCFGENSCR